MDNNTIYNINSDTPIIISVPHSGTHIPLDIKCKFNNDAILSNTDWFLPELFDFLKDMNFTMLINNINRYVIDVNRKVNINDPFSLRTNLVFHKNSYGQIIYKNALSKKSINERIKNYYEPYHDALKELIEYKLKRFNKLYLIDLHSYSISNIKSKILISNNNEMSSSKESFDFLCNAFIKNHFDILKNEIFTGGYITQYYSKRYKDKVECIQIEIPYNLYIEDRDFYNEEISNYDEILFNQFKNRLIHIVNYIFEHTPTLK